MVVASSTGASNTGVSTSATVLVAPVLSTMPMVLVAGSTGATNNVLQASTLETHC